MRKVATLATALMLIVALPTGAAFARRHRHGEEGLGAEPRPLRGLREVRQLAPRHGYGQTEPRGLGRARSPRSTTKGGDGWK